MSINFINIYVIDYINLIWLLENEDASIAR